MGKRIMKTKIIGHRGAAGLAPENSLAGVRAALEYGVDAVEIDVRLSADRRLVLMHKRAFVPQQRLGTIKDIRREHKVTTLDKALDAANGSRVIVDVKDYGLAEKLVELVSRHKGAKVSYASFFHDELRAIRKLQPDAEIYMLDHFSPIDIISNALRLGADGVGLNKWLMNPLTYRLAKRHGLKLYVYTINSRFIARLFGWFYPEAAICTDHPERFNKRRRKKKHGRHTRIRHRRST